MQKYISGVGVVGLTPEEEAAVRAEWAENDPSTPERMAASKLTEINIACDAAMAKVSAGYPESEVLTWGKQEQEARAWAANNAEPMPFVSALATERGIAASDLAGRIVAKADLYAAASAAIVGQRQRLEDQIVAILADELMADADKSAAIELIAWVAA